MLNAGQRIAILAGAGALEATDELILVSKMLDAPIIKALLGKACVPDDHPYSPAASACSARNPRSMPCRVATRCS